MKIPTGTVTFLFTDIEDSTTLAQEYSKTWEFLRQNHDHILRQAIESHNGYVFRIVGDAFCAAFDAAGEALRAALHSQTELQSKPWDGPPIKVRMGIHTGKAEIQEDGEYLGYLTLTRVQRVMSAAHGGQILLSNAAAELVQSELPEGVSLLNMKEHRLKGLQNPERLWQVSAPGLLHDFPPLQSLNSVPNNLPAQLTSFVGREREIATLQQELQAHRLITLTGPGGVGKTRLSIEVAARVLDGFRHGVWFVELANVIDPAQVAMTIAHMFKVPELPGRKIVDVLKDYLRDKDLLLILDNFEQVIEAAAFVKELILTAHGLRVMITSRTPLRVAGEYEYRVPLLSIPSEQKPLELDRLARMESVQLFIERARSAKADFHLTRDNAAAVLETCRRLDGLPLAIELAAARVRVLPPQKMIGQLDDRLRFLTSNSRDLPSRQQTLRGAIAWSYDLLTPTEKLLFRRMSVFVGGATLEAIESVCNDDQLDILGHLESLLDKSLLRQLEQDGEPRYEMLGTIRDFAEETLLASGEAIQTQARHLSYFHQLAHAAEPQLVSPDELQWIMRLTADHDNLHAAILWGLKNEAEKAVEVLCDLALFWSRGGHNEEVIGWLRLALTHPALAASEAASREARNLRARVQLTLGILSLQQDYPDAPSTIGEAITLLRQVGNKTDLAVALAFYGYLGDLEAARESVSIARATDNKWILAYCLVWQSQALRLAGGDLQLARQSAAEGARLSREIGSVWAVARSVFSQGQLAVVLGAWEEARAYLRECMALFSQSQDRYHANLARTELAHVERRQGRHIEARQLYQEAVVIWQDLGLQTAVARQLECLAMIAAMQGNLEDAVQLAGAAGNEREPSGFPVSPDEPAEYRHTLVELRSRMEPSRFEELLRQGQAMSIPEAIDKAIALT